MKIEQFAEFAAAIVQSLPRDMDTTTGQDWITNRDALARVLRQALMPTVTQKSDPTILTLAGTATVRLAANFVAREFFKVNTKENEPVKISYVGEYFTQWFLDKTKERPNANDAVPNGGPYRTSGENGTTVVVLRYHTLNNNLVDGDIIDKLGGEVNVETTLAEIAACMTKQASGERGALLTNGFMNIFYVRDANRVLRPVRVGWYGDGWGVYANSVERPSEWRAGNQVFSRDS